MVAIRYKPGSSVASVKAVEVLCGSACAFIQGHWKEQRKQLLSSIAQAEPRFRFEGAKLKLIVGDGRSAKRKRIKKLSYNKRLQATAQSAGRFAPGTLGGP